MEIVEIVEYEKDVKDTPILYAKMWTHASTPALCPCPSLSATPLTTVTARPVQSIDPSQDACVIVPTSRQFENFNRCNMYCTAGALIQCLGFP